MTLKQKNKQNNRMQTLVWATIAVVAVLIVALIVLDTPKPPSTTTGSATFAYDKLPVLGDPKAPVKIVEYGDYKCPSCQYFALDVKKQLQKDFIDKGAVALFFMNLPIVGPDSYTAAYAAQSVYHQNPEAFWTYFDTLYANQQDESKTWATPEFLIELAKVKNLPINYDQLKQDIDSMKYKAEIDEQIASADKNGVSGTPTLFINGQKFENVFDYNALKAAIEKVQKDAK